MRGTTFELPDDLVARAEDYAARHGTSITAIVRAHLEAVTETGPPPEALLAFSRGLISRQAALAALGLRDYADLLVALGEHDLAPPRPSDDEIRDQALAFERVWRAG